MRKTLIPMLVSLALCGAAIVAVVTTNARAQAAHKPVMAALLTPDLQMAANTSAAPDSAGRDMRMPPPVMMDARRKEICDELYAREVGRLAYTEAKLRLTPAQQPLFDHWKAIRLDIARHHDGFCSDHHREPGTRPLNIVDRMARHEDRLKKRLADLDSERPALETLYAALSSQQKMQMGFDGGPGAMGGRMLNAAMGGRGEHPFAMGPRSERTFPMDAPPPAGPPPPR